MKYLPKEKSTKSYVDVIGLFLIAAIATSVILFISNFNWLYLIGFIIAMTLFLVYISKSPKALIDISFFKNKNFIRTLSVAFVIYTVQLGYIFTFPFILEGVYGLKLDVISLLLIPGYITAIIVGMLSGKIAKYLSSKQAISIALIGIAASLLIPGLFVGSTVVIFVISMMLFSGSFAFMYAPMLETCIRTIPKDKSGTAIGFYNLTLNVAASIGITYTAAMLDKVEISTILIVLSIIAFVSLGLFVTLLSKLEKTN